MKRKKRTSGDKEATSKCGKGSLDAPKVLRLSLTCDKPLPCTGRILHLLIAAKQQLWPIHKNQLEYTLM